MNVLRTIGARFLVKGANKIAGSDTKPFVKNAVIATASHGISMVRGFVSGYLVARLLPRAVFGEYQFLLSIFGSVGFLGLPGLEKAMPRAVARGEGGAIPRIFKWHLCICLIGSIALLGITFFLTPERQHLWSALVIGALILPITQSSATLFGAMSSGLGRFDLSLKANLARSVAIVVAVLIIIFLKPSSLLLFLTVTAFPAISYLWFVRGIMPANDPSIPARPILKYALEMTILTLPAYLATYADKLLISAYFGLNQLAVFSAGILIPEQIKIWAKELLPVSLASQSKGDDTLKRRMSLLRIVGRITLLWLIPVIVGIFLTPLFFALYLRPELFLNSRICCPTIPKLFP